MRDHSQHARSATASVNTDHATPDVKKSIPMRTTRIETAVMTRVRSKAR
jgi:hypothetical protein